MSEPSFVVRIISQVFPSYNGKINGSVMLLLGCHLASTGALAAAIVFPAALILLAILSVLLLLLAILLDVDFSKTLKYTMQETIDEISSIFCNLESGEMNLASPSLNQGSKSTRKIRLQYGEFLTALRQLIEEMRKIGIDIAVDAAKVASSVRDTTQKTAEQFDISNVVSAASIEAKGAIAEVSESAQYVSDKTPLI